MNVSYFSIIANKRLNTGSRSSNQLRCKNKIPGIIYNKNISIPIFCDKKNINNIFKEYLFGTNLIKCVIDNDKFLVVIKDFHKHPFKSEILHFDFQRVLQDDIVNVKVFLKFLGEKQSLGIKHGGFLIKYMSSVFIRSKVSNIPKYIDVDISNLNINTSIFLSEIVLPKNVSLSFINNQSKSRLIVASISGSKVSEIKDSVEKK